MALIYICHWCHLVNEKLQWCGKCRGVKYCSKACQSNDWKTHKNNCKAIEFESNKQFVATIKQLFGDRNLVDFLAALAYQSRLLGLKYLLIELDEGGSRLRCSGTNELLYCFTEENMLEDKLNCMFIHKCSQEVIFSFAGHFDIIKVHEKYTIISDKITDQQFTVVINISRSKLVITVKQTDHTFVTNL